MPDINWSTVFWAFGGAFCGAVICTVIVLHWLGKALDGWAKHWLWKR